jgi:hypothetical protein
MPMVMKLGVYDSADPAVRRATIEVETRSAGARRLT